MRTTNDAAMNYTWHCVRKYQARQVYCTYHLAKHAPQHPPPRMSLYAPLDRALAAEPPNAEDRISSPKEDFGQVPSPLWDRSPVLFETSPESSLGPVSSPLWDQSWVPWKNCSPHLHPLWNMPCPSAYLEKCHAPFPKYEDLLYASSIAWPLIVITMIIIVIIIL